jgi:hypothetical protein
MEQRFYNRRETDVQRYRRREQNAMIRTRLLLSSLSIAHALAALLIPERSALRFTANVWDLGWQLPLLLGALAVLMLGSALAEFWGCKKRALHEFSASMLAVQWAVIWAYSWEGGADYLTFLAPVYVFFIGWAVVAEAHDRRLKITKLPAVT